jgi:tetratricopeptide (TPR) repeat protein
MGDMYFDLGDYEKAQEGYRKALAFMGNERFSPSWRALLNVAIVRARVVQGKGGEPAEELPQAFAANKNRGFAGWIALYIAEIRLRQGAEDLSEAGIWVDKALSLNRESGMRLLLGRGLLLQAELAERRGSAGAAQQHLQEAIAIFQECGAGGYLQKAKTEWIRLASLSMEA